MTTYSSYTAKTRSEKLVLCHIEPTERLLIWTLDSGAIYTRQADYFIIDILEGTTSLTEASSASLNSGEWYFNPETSTVYVRTSDDSNPSTKDIVGKYRLFYANAPIDLPYDLLNGSDVHYEGVLNSNSPITKQLDDEQIGVALESATKISLNNGNGLFDDMYDTLFFENKTVKLYSWNENILMSEKQLLFDGIIQDKSFSTKEVGFNCKDFVFKLREPLSLSLFTTSDGDISESNLNTPKRRIYGKVDQVKCVPVDNILGGYSITGTVSGANASAILTGSGTSFLDECSPQDRLFVPVATEIFEVSIASVDSDTQITLSDELTLDFSGISMTNLPNRPWRKKNRNWHIADHKLRAPSTTVLSATQPNRFIVVSGLDIFDGETIEVDSESATVKRITDNNIVLASNLQGGTPSNGDTVTKNPISKAYIGKEEIFIDRDWTVTNTTEAILNLENDAEFNIARSVSINGTLTFTNGSRTVTASGVDLVNEVQSRDWIQSPDISHTTWYEILSVSESQLTLRVAYAGSTVATSGSSKKNVDILDDDGTVLVNCMGMEYSGSWIKTGSDAVRNMLIVDAGLSVNEASFTQAGADAPYTLSMVIPDSIGGEIPAIRDVVTNINQSIFGSLINNSDWELTYNVLTQDKPTDLVVIEDHDVLGEIRVRSKNEIARKVNAQYRPFIDRFSGESTFKLYEFTNTFVDNYIGAKSEIDTVIYLYEDSDAQEIAERIGLYNSLSQSVVSLSGKLNFMLNNLNDKVFLNFDRLYKRFGGRDRRKIGMISKITKDGLNTRLELNDLGNTFNRVMSIADNSSNDFTSSTNSEKIVNAYVLDNNLEIPDTSNDTYLGSGIIG